MNKEKKVDIKTVFAIVAGLVAVFSIIVYANITKEVDKTPGQVEDITKIPDFAQKDHRAEEGNTAGMALQMANQFVEKRLKSPSTAEFGRYYETEVEVKKNGDSYSINSYVDSENGFGAMTRTNFTAEVRYDGGGNWSLISLELE